MTSAPRFLVNSLHTPWFWLLLSIALYTPWIDSEVELGNVASDLAAIESIVERRTFFIEDSTFSHTIDKFKRDEHFFSQKSPVFHLVAALPYGALYGLGFRLSEDTALCLGILTFFMVVAPMGWLLWLIFDHPWVRLRSLRVRLWLTLAFALGSLLTPFAVTLNHYVLASACLMMAVRALTESSLGSRKSPARLALSIGFWTSASLAADVPPAFLFALGTGAMWCGRRRERWIGALAGGVPLIALYAALNSLIIGSPLPANFHEEEMQYFEGSYWAEVKARADAGEPGFYQASYPRRLLHSTLGHKGIYWMMPLLVGASLISIALARRRAPGWTLALALALFPLATIALVMRWAFDLSGGAYTIRHASACIAPLYCVLAHPEAPRLGRRGKTLAWIAAVWGCLIAGLGVGTPWSHNTLSAIPPLENLARICLNPSWSLPTAWIPRLIRTTSVTLPNAWLDLGLEHLNAGRLDEAERALRQATESDPRITLNYYHLGIAQDMNGKPGAAMETYRTLIELEPENVGARNNFGLFALKAGRMGTARQAYEASLGLAPDNASALWGLILIEDRERNASARASRLRRALELYPSDPRFIRLARRWNIEPPR